MRWIVIGLACLGIGCVLAAWLFTRGADNADARAIATIAYLPGIIVLAFDAVIAALWGLWLLLH